MDDIDPELLQAAYRHGFLSGFNGRYTDAPPYHRQYDMRSQKKLIEALAAEWFLGMLQGIVDKESE